MFYHRTGQMRIAQMAAAPSTKTTDAVMAGTSEPAETLKLTCHCTGITISLPHPPPRPLNECRCSICFSYGALWGYYYPARETVIVTESKGCTVDSYYRTDGDRTGALAFQRCSRCGCVFAWRRTDPTKGSGKMGINFRLMGEDVMEMKRIVSYK
ncbi:hypothetical protein QBC47DRAFT_395858 [Echria macrotheca]|uniref:CENP-V/GFA domain-containing protein n=1 Tax=Echria macrotheca TaxID=438768 RepID=A0AAJ0B1E5_9PEZI|nr:hypothetical protein QBC47DRAFT_395858 [Echria macrotheca]